MTEKRKMSMAEMSYWKRNNGNTFPLDYVKGKTFYMHPCNYSHGCMLRACGCNVIYSEHIEMTKIYVFDDKEMQNETPWQIFR